MARLAGVLLGLGVAVGVGSLPSAAAEADTVAASNVRAGSGSVPMNAAGSAPMAATVDGFDRASDDYARSFDAAYVVNTDGSVAVTQTIEWTFPANGQRHGIYRTVTVRAGYRDSQDTYRYYSLNNVEVTSPSGAPTDVSISDFGADKKIRVGSPSKTVTGTQTYVVRFTLGHVVNDIGDGTAEFYYNTVSTSNEEDYRAVSAYVTGPVAATKVACFVGERGSTQTCQATAGETSAFTIPALVPGQGASIVASWPRAAFGDLAPDLRRGSATTSASSPVSPAVARTLGWLATGGGVLLPLLAAAGMGFLVWTRGRDEHYVGLTPGVLPGRDQAQTAVIRGGRTPTIAVQFTPPPGVQPGMLGTVLDEQANVVDVTATLIDLAARGHLTLTAPDRSSAWLREDWILTRSQSVTDTAALAPYEQQLLDSVFASGPSVHLNDLKNSFAPTLKIVQRMMYEETVERGWFRRSPESQRGAYVGLGIALVVLSGLALFFGWSFFAAIGADAGMPVNPGLVLGGGGLIAGGITMALGRAMAARTAMGSAILAQSKGFRQYLATAEANQIRWEEAQEIFSRFLPYAIVFGLTRRWAKVFEEVAAAATAAGHVVLMPTWYVGPWGSATFDNIAADMDSFSTQAAGTFVSTPGSSGTSGFSSGGGFSGGGGGGGGGGSW